MWIFSIICSTFSCTWYATFIVMVTYLSAYIYIYIRDTDVIQKRLKTFSRVIYGDGLRGLIVRNTKIIKISDEKKKKKKCVRRESDTRVGKTVRASYVPSEFPVSCVFAAREKCDSVAFRRFKTVRRCEQREHSVRTMPSAGTHARVTATDRTGRAGRRTPDAARENIPFPSAINYARKLAAPAPRAIGRRARRPGPFRKIIKNLSVPGIALLFTGAPINHDRN